MRAQRQHQTPAKQKCTWWVQRETPAGGCQPHTHQGGGGRTQPRQQTKKEPPPSPSVSPYRGLRVRRRPMTKRNPGNKQAQENNRIPMGEEAGKTARLRNNAGEERSRCEDNNTKAEPAARKTTTKGVAPTGKHPKGGKRKKLSRPRLQAETGENSMPQDPQLQKECAEKTEPNPEKVSGRAQTPPQLRTETP